MDGVARNRVCDRASLFWSSSSVLGSLQVPITSFSAALQHLSPAAGPQTDAWFDRLLETPWAGALVREEPWPVLDFRAALRPHPRARWPAGP